MLDNAKPGDTLRFTLTSVPRTESGRKTVARLMRLDAGNKRALKRAQHRRVTDLVVRSRGGRPWEVRRTVSKVVRVIPGAEWSVAYTPALAPDIRSVAKYLKIGRA
jgi:hypothetical protein